MPGSRQLQLQQSRIVALEDELERLRLRRIGIPGGAGLGVVLGASLWNSIAPGPLSRGNVTWIAVSFVAAFAILVLNEQSCRRTTNRIRRELASAYEELAQIVGRSGRG